MLQSKLDRYVYVSMSQFVKSAGRLRFHLIGPRLARWLLMSQDRSNCKDFHVSQKFLAFMLGVPRVGITGAAGLLQRAGLIEYRRGELTVLNRAGFKAAACRCGTTDREGYRKLF